MLILVGVVAHSSRARAQFGTTSHQVSVEVDRVVEIGVSPASVTMEITADDLMPGLTEMVESNSSSQLYWRINGPNKKVTVQSDLATPTYAMTAEAVSPSVGTAAGPVELDGGVGDFLRDVAKSQGQCVIRYRAEVEVAEGPGSESHTVVYTVTDQ